MAKETPPRSKVDYDKEQDKNGKVTSLEMLKDLGVTGEMLPNAHSARLKSKKDVRGFLYIYFELGFPAGSKPLTITSGPIAVPAVACA